jgi:hypothetical protein
MSVLHNKGRSKSKNNKEERDEKGNVRLTHARQQNAVEG